MEKIKRDSNRVNISKLNPDEINGDDVTGGYILKFDWFWTGDNLGGFESSHGSLYNYHYPQPDDIAPEQEAYIQQYIENFEDIMFGQGYNDPNTGYPAHMDVGSFIDLIMLHELSKNVDAYRLSTYIYKDKESIDDRLIAGPIWDINHGYGNCDYGDTWLTTDWLLDYDPTGDPIAFWWTKLWNDDNFKAEFSDRFTELRSTILSEEHIESVIDSIASYLGPAVTRNFARWPILGSYIWPNYYVFDTYSQEIEYLKDWINLRLEWMDQEMLSLKIYESLIINYHAYDPFPNPFNPVTTLRYDLPEDAMVSITIYDIMGRSIKSLVNSNQTAGYRLVRWNATNNLDEPVSAGMYIYTIQAGDFRQTKKMVLLK